MERSVKPAHRPEFLDGLAAISAEAELVLGRSVSPRTVRRWIHSQESPLPVCALGDGAPAMRPLVRRRDLVDWLSTRRDRRRSTIPERIDGLSSAVLGAVVRLSLHVARCPREPLTIEAVADALGASDDVAELERRGLLSVDDDGRVVLLVSVALREVRGRRRRRKS